MPAAKHAAPQLMPIPIAPRMRRAQFFMTPPDAQWDALMKGQVLYATKYVFEQSEVRNGQSQTFSMADNKTKPTDASVEDYIASRANAQQHADCKELMLLFKKVTRHSPRMWGPSIVGYGSYRYTYESGRTGEMPLAAFAIRGRDLVVYVMAEGEEQRSLLSKIGKHKMGKSCLYFRQLADLDKSVLEKLVVGCIADVRRRYR
jgi:hypothetical protein